MLTLIAALALAVVLLLPAISTNAQATSGNWEIAFIESENDAGQYSSIAVDSGDFVHIAFYDETQGALMHAYNTLGSWIVQERDAGDVGLYASIAVDSNDNVHISYYDATNKNLKYANDTLGTWTTSVLDSTGDVGLWTSIAVDSNDYVHISYYDATDQDLKYANNTQGTWSSSTIDTDGNVGQYSSITTDDCCKIHISYYDATNQNLKYATNVLGPWDRSPLDSDGDVGKYTSIAINATQAISISYYDATNQDLKFATNASGSWTREVVDSDGNTGMYTSMCVGTGGEPHISYYDGSSMDLMYSYLDDEWSTSVIDSEDDVGQWTGIAADSTGNIHISYFDVTNTALKYARSHYELPSEPRQLTTLSGDEFVELSWLPPLNSGSTTITNYTVYRGTSPLSLSPLVELGSVLSYNDTLVVNDQTYYYQVTAINSEGEGAASEMVNATPSAFSEVPSPPQNPQAHPGDSHVLLEWQPPQSSGTGQVTNYKVYRGQSSTSLELLTTVGTTREYNDTSVTNGVTYYYAITAVNSAGEGNMSSVISALPNPPSPATEPGPPRNLDGEAGDGYVNLTWLAPSDDGGAAITNYKVYRGTSSGSTTLLETIGVQLWYNDTTAEEGKTYFYQVTAFNPVGEGEDIEVEVSTGGGGGDIDPMIWVIVIVVAVIIIAVVYFLMRGGGGQQGQQQKPDYWSRKNSGRRKEKW